MLYGPTNEELITEIFRASVKSYKSLPQLLYHIQWKFRDELRPRFGVMRCKEFFMKDAYSFDVSDDEAKKSYNKMYFSYLHTFKRLGLTAIPMAADTGPIGGDLSHEFIILAETGESKIYSDKRIFDIDISKHNDTDDSIQELRKKYDAFYAVTDDKFSKKYFEEKVKKENQLVTKGIEVGHIFYFGDKYSKPLKCSVDLKDGKKVDVKMGSYGIGVSRLVGAIIEAKFNNNIMKWPNSVAPFEVAIIPSLQKNDKSNYLKAEKIYSLLTKNNIDVLFDDTDEHLSAKFKKFDLIGVPYQIILGSQSTDNKFEFKEINGETTTLSLEEIKNKLLNKRNLN
jgi:prolyl-tRNA synthetase